MENENKICAIFELYPEIKSVYLFGSRAMGKAVKNSDYDFAILVDENLSKGKRFNLRLKLMAELSRAFKTDAVDVVILNDLVSLFFKYAIIKEGKVVYQRNDLETAEFESRTLGLYFDFQPFLEEYNRSYLNR